MSTNGTLTAKNATFTNCTVSGNVTTESGNLKTIVNQGGISFYYKSGTSWVSTGTITPNYSTVSGTSTYTGHLRIASPKEVSIINNSDFGADLVARDKKTGYTKQAGISVSNSGGIVRATMSTYNSASTGNVYAYADGAGIGVTGRGTSSVPSAGAAFTKNTASIHANTGVSSSHVEMSMANGKINFYQDSTQTYTGSIYLTYGNGGKIYLTVKGGLIYGWTV